MVRRSGIGFDAAARALRGRCGPAILESALALPGAHSLAASDPGNIVAGGPEDWPRFEAELARRSRNARGPGLPDGAAIGWVGFDGRFCFGFYDRVQIFSHKENAWLDEPPVGEAHRSSEPPAIAFRPRMNQAGFERIVRRAQDYIAAGDIYQVCLAHRFTAPAPADAWPFYEALRDASPAPFAAFLDLDGTQIVSSSPELFLRLSGRRILTRPIKGTRPRRADSQLDQRQARDLLTSPKEAAELIMITDLERNDLGCLCEYGSVAAVELLKLESYEQVHHLVSTVQGTLRPDVTHTQALRACMPGGSISGAPKKRALEIISELEPEPRGIYTGAIGYFGYNGESQFSMAIRTAVFAGGEAGFHVGAGIVADSDPAREWQETLDKAAGLLAAAGYR